LKLSQLIQYKEFKHATDYLFRLNKNISTGVVTAYFIFPANFELNGEAVDKYATIIEVKQDGNGVGVKIKFNSLEIGNYFWDTWKCNYKFEVND
jgi:hypothetical protein